MHQRIQTGHLDSKFGFDLTQVDEAIELIQDEYASLNLKGMHAHIGSQIFRNTISQHFLLCFEYLPKQEYFVSFQFQHFFVAGASGPSKSMQGRQQL